MRNIEDSNIESPFQTSIHKQPKPKVDSLKICIYESTMDTKSVKHSYSATFINKMRQQTDNDDHKKQVYDQNNDEKTASKFNHSKSPKTNPSTYNPNGLDRAQRQIKISKPFTDTTIPDTIKDKTIKNIYDFIDKSTAVAVCSNNYYENQQLRIFNYGFCNALDQALYCIVDKKEITNFAYQMRSKLFTAKEIFSVLNQRIDLPYAVRHSVEYRDKLQHNMNKLKVILSDYKMVIKWNKVPVLNIMNKKQKTEFNKERITCSMPTEEFVRRLKHFMKNDKNMLLVPIVMFCNNKYRIEYVHIVKLSETAHIGIAYIYNDTNDVTISGIHLNKDNILSQHQLISNHNCECLKDFKSAINDFHIGNPDDYKNRYNALNKNYNDLKKNNPLSQLKTQNESLKQRIVNITDESDENKKEIVRLKDEIAKLKIKKQPLTIEISTGSNRTFSTTTPYGPQPCTFSTINRTFSTITPYGPHTCTFTNTPYTNIPYPNTPSHIRSGFPSLPNTPMPMTTPISMTNTPMPITFNKFSNLNNNQITPISNFRQNYVNVNLKNNISATAKQSNNNRTQ